MALNHLNLAVPDVAQTRTFFETYFGFTCLETKGDNIISCQRTTDTGHGCSVYNNKSGEDTKYLRLTENFER